MADTNANDGSAAGGWMADVQRALAIMLIGTLCLCILAVTAKVVFSGDPPTLNDMAKTLQAALVNMGLIGLGFFFGNTIAKMQQDSSQQRLTDKLASATSGSPPPPPPPSAPTPWWTKLTDAEKNAITVAARGPAGGMPDARIGAFVTASQVGAATSDDLAYLVAKGLLTQARADEIKAA